MENSERKLIWQAPKQIQGYSYVLYEAEELEIETLEQKVCEVEVLENFFLTNLPLKDVLSAIFKIREMLKQNGHQNSIKIYSLYRAKEGIFEFVGMGGLMPLNTLSLAVAEIWFLSEPMTKHSRFLANYSKELLNSFLEEYPILVNVVASWNTINIKWLKRLGFYVETEPKIKGNYQTLYHRFYICRC